MQIGFPFACRIMVTRCAFATSGSAKRNLLLARPSRCHSCGTTKGTKSRSNDVKDSSRNHSFESDAEIRLCATELPSTVVQCSSGTSVETRRHCVGEDSDAVAREIDVTSSYGAICCGDSTGSRSGRLPLRRENPGPRPRRNRLSWG